MRKRYVAWLVLVTLAAVAGCAKYIIVPPAINLMDYADLGMVVFREEGVKGELGES